MNNGTTIGNLSREQDTSSQFRNMIHDGFNNDQQQFSQFNNQGNFDKFDIEQLTRDIHNNLPSDAFESFDDSYNEKKEEKEEGFQLFGDSIPAYVKDATVILVLYIILSQAVVRDSFGKFIPQLNPDSEGKYSFSGVLIYGIILAVLFVLVRKFI